MAAPHPLPTEVKRARGTLRADRQPKALAVVGVVERSVEPPDTLGDVGANEWRHVLSWCSWIAPSDLTTLRLYCTALDRASELEAKLAEDGYVLYTDKGYAYLNPAHGALATTEAQITKWQSLLGLSPSARGQIGAAEVKAKSKVEELADRRAQRAGRHAG